MKNKYFFILSIISIISGCNSSSDNNYQTNIEQNTTNISNMLKIKSRLYRNKLTGAYYFKFCHIPVEAKPENRFIPLFNLNDDPIKNINEKAFKQFFGFYVDDNYMFRVVEHYCEYKVYTFPIDSIEPGCYFIDSNYRISENNIEYYNGMGITSCNSLPNLIIKIALPASAYFRVLNIEGYDCAILNNKILIDGCWLSDLPEKDTLLLNKIRKAVKKQQFKLKYCYPMVQ